jgi:hypothetical protein
VQNAKSLPPLVGYLQDALQGQAPLLSNLAAHASSLHPVLLLFLYAANCIRKLCCQLLLRRTDAARLLGYWAHAADELSGGVPVCYKHMLKSDANQGGSTAGG